MCIRTPFWLWVIAVGSICAAPWFSSTHVNAQEPPPESSEARSLFNGTDLQNWDGDPRLWSVRDGVIHGETTPELSAKGNTFLIWQGGEVRNFILRFRFRCNAENNSGVQYRSKHYQESDAANPWVVRGYQHEIRNESQLPNVTGFIYDEWWQTPTLVPSRGESSLDRRRKRGHRFTLGCRGISKTLPCR